MTFDALAIVIPLLFTDAVAPIPISDLFDPIRSRDVRLNDPSTKTTRGSLSDTAAVKSFALLTVIVSPPSPPVTDPKGLSWP